MMEGAALSALKVWDPTARVPPGCFAAQAG